MKLLTLEVEPERADDPGLLYELAMAKHDEAPVTVTVGGFEYQVLLRRVQVEVVVR